LRCSLNLARRSFLFVLRLTYEFEEDTRVCLLLFERPTRDCRVMSGSSSNPSERLFVPTDTALPTESNNRPDVVGSLVIRHIQYMVYKLVF
jgi:hypothetical protein